MSSILVFRHKHVIVDACSVINLYATRRMREIICAAPVQFYVASYVLENELNAKSDRAPIDLSPMIEQGLITIYNGKPSEIADQIIKFANEGIRGNGEKISGAVAVANNWAILSDDFHAMQKFAQLVPAIQTFSTLDLIRYWAETRSIALSDLKDTLNQMRIGGNYIPSRKHPLFAWVERVLVQTENTLNE